MKTSTKAATRGGMENKKKQMRETDLVGRKKEKKKPKTSLAEKNIIARAPPCSSCTQALFRQFAPLDRNQTITSHRFYQRMGEKKREKRERDVKPFPLHLSLSLSPGAPLSSPSLALSPDVVSFSFPHVIPRSHLKATKKRRAEHELFSLSLSLLRVRVRRRFEERERRSGRGFFSRRRS